MRKVMKLMEVTNKKQILRKRQITNRKKNKSIYILGDSTLKQVEGWKLKKSIDKNHNVYVRSFFPG